ncbi:unnamed protein product [Acanthoscelides obtectus]|uniref:Uncharacterized protein n=1 Tax=Acanthoscelides obtectus TaxID=200917 RepID=A0A9P0LV21_ACAOB|nr:unnamed protein product [Acanthoscelides obtectus]CAH2016059.1 unnamed protein product [Acanthoscelides obtectus]CAK1633665.1 hypothetical protein AOBTE_LOCUS8302 [Acanthoscelides obtectus]CAK1651428.1 hypothetical protein AOBTE_LOCUS17263 [Acanthoscelides obtectus]
MSQRAAATRTWMIHRVKTRKMTSCWMLLIIRNKMKQMEMQNVRTNTHHSKPQDGLPNASDKMRTPLHKKL